MLARTRGWIERTKFLNPLDAKELERKREREKERERVKKVTRQDLM